MNYIGSKYKLLSFLEKNILNTVKDIKSCVFCDLFAGTGIVGRYFKLKTKQIISNDIESYSYILNRNYIGNHRPLNNGGLIDELNNLKGIEGFIYKNYCIGSGSGRQYFSDENGKKIDAIRQKIQEWKEINKITDDEYYFLLSSLLESADKVANTASVYGAFLKQLKKTAQKTLILEPANFQVNDHDHQVYCQDANELIKKIKGDILYLDPPYNARQYCANYHVLETIARYDYPELYGKTGLRDYSQQKSSFCSRKDVVSVFEDLISKAKFRYIFLSYNNEGLMALDSIGPVMRKYGRYSCRTKAYRRFKADQDNNRKIAATSTIEYLHCLEKDI